MNKLYRQFNLTKVVESPFYHPHVHAITGEGLHAKMDIAAELASRDMEIERLRLKLLEVSNRKESNEW